MTNTTENIIRSKIGGVTSTDSKETPEFIRLPQPGQKCKYTGLSRSTLNELCVDGTINDHNAKVKSTLLKKRGAMRGIRLISYDSLMSFLNSSNEEGIIVS